MTLKTIIANRLAKLTIIYSIEEWSKLYGTVGLKKGVFLDADPELMQVMKKKMKEHLIKVFVIEAENIEKCRTALKKKGIFPKDFISEEKQMEETACESRNFRR